jgi:thiosulfate/3-mercaptopyruvate sulfurtransferase
MGGGMTTPQNPATTQIATTQAAVATDASPAPLLLPLADAAALHAALDHPRLRIIDLAWEGDAAAAFEAGHIPGAVHSPYGRDPWRGLQSGVRNVAPDDADLAALLGRLGVTPASHVVLVAPWREATHAAAAARAFWTLRWAGHAFASVLHGGMRAWTADPARPIATGPSRVETAPPYPIRHDALVRSDLAATQAAVSRGASALLDARSAAVFAGAQKSGDVARFGRLPGALNLDYTAAFDAGVGELLPRDALESLFAAVPEGPVVNYCNTGHTAALNWFILAHVLGRPDVSLFDGSMSEWARDPDRPMVVGG